jgi:hypothetical protein
MTFSSTSEGWISIPLNAKSHAKPGSADDFNNLAEVAAYVVQRRVAVQDLLDGDAFQLVNDSQWQRRPRKLRGSLMLHGYDRE